MRKSHYQDASFGPRQLSLLSIFDVGEEQFGRLQTETDVHPEDH
jgi:hypothetical protein